jgi:hypothetical protein
MNKRIRKKYLKQHGLYVHPKETWSLDITLAQYIIPRLKLYKKLNDVIPGRLESHDEWDKILDKMIYAFECMSDESCNYGVNTDLPNWIEEYDKRQKKVKEGLQLFADYFQALWW